MSLSSRHIRRGLAAGGAVLLLGGATLGVAAAQAQPTPSGQQAPSGYQAFIDALAKRLGITPANLQQAITDARADAGLPAGGPGSFGRGHGPRHGFRVELDAAAQAIGISVDQLRQELPGKSLAQVAVAHGKTGNDVAAALKNAAHQRVDQAVTAGRLTADQATQRKQQMDQRIDQMVNQVKPQGGPGGREDFGGRSAFRFGLTEAAQAIGISVDQLRQELPGKSLAQVAVAHGKTGNDVAAALKNAAHQRLDQAVTAGRVTADQANQQKTQIDQRIDQMVNQVLPQRGPRAESNSETDVD